jgi:hypothetical protein
MRTHALPIPWVSATGLLLACLLGRPAFGQVPLTVPADPPADPVLPRPADVGRWLASPDADRAAARSRYVRLFHMPTGFLSDPVGSDLDPDPSPGAPDTATAPDADGADLPVGATLSLDYPYFDFRLPGDPGGAGFYKIHTQLQVLESEKTGCTIGLQALTPAGLENDGVEEGPTVLVPNIALYHELFEGLEVQGFVGKNVRCRSGWGDHPGRSLDYGVALAHPLPGFDTGPLPRVDLFVEALGRYRMNGTDTNAGPPSLNLVPGLHWRMGDNWWLSGGVLLPVGTPRMDVGKWQLTCSWQF